MFFVVFALTCQRGSDGHSLHRHHLEMSPSPFKWEVSGRALRTVSVGKPEQKVTGSEQEHRCAPSPKHLRTASLCCPSAPSRHLTHPPLTDSLHCDGPEQRLASEPLSHTIVREELRRERKRGRTEVCFLSLWRSALGAAGLVSEHLKCKNRALSWTNASDVLKALDVFLSRNICF